MKNGEDAEVIGYKKLSVLRKLNVNQILKLVLIEKFYDVGFT